MNPSETIGRNSISNRKRFEEIGWNRENKNGLNRKRIISSLQSWVTNINNEIKKEKKKMPAKYRHNLDYGVVTHTND